MAGHATKGVLLLNVQNFAHNYPLIAGVKNNAARDGNGLRVHRSSGGSV